MLGDMRVATTDTDNTILVCRNNIPLGELKNNNINDIINQPNVIDCVAFKCFL